MTEPESKLKIVERHVDDVTVLVLAGEMLVDDGDLAFRRHVHDLIDRGRVKILVNLANVTYVDSSGVGMMVAKMKTVRDRGGDLKLVHVTTRSQRILGTLKIQSIFEIFHDEASAVRSFSGHAE